MPPRLFWARNGTGDHSLGNAKPQAANRNIATWGFARYGGIARREPHAEIAMAPDSRPRDRSPRPLRNTAAPAAYRRVRYATISVPVSPLRPAAARSSEVMSARPSG